MTGLEASLQKSRPLSVLSLFAGIGGIDLGLEAHGCTTTAYSEIDPYASSVMAARFPDAVNLGDVSTIVWEDANREHGPFDIICGGFPCQPFSAAGRRRGLADDRWMWPAFADAIRVLRPRGVLVENVPDLARDRDAFGWVLGDLAALGFDAEWSVLSACSVGAPHTRRRLFVVAHHDSVDGQARVGARSEGSRPLPRFDHRARSPRDTEGWLLEAAGDFCGEADGVPARLDARRAWNHRLRCLGNAVVPQVAELVAGRLMHRIEAAA